MSPPQSPGGGAKNNVALAPPYHVGKSHTKFGYIPPSGLGGDTIMDRWTDGQTEGKTISPFAFFKKRGDN